MIHGCMNCMGCLIRKTRETVPLSGAAVPAAGAVWGGGWKGGTRTDASTKVQ